MFYWGRAKFNNFFYFLALYMLVCVSNSKLLNTYENINVCTFVFFHTMLIVVQSTQMTIKQFYLSANSVYLVVYTLCITPGGCFVHPLGEDTLLVHPIEVYPSNCLILGLKMQLLLIHVSNCATFVGTVCIHV